jgi:hypothetical protein
MHPLVGEAMKKAAIAWLTVAGHRPYPVWCLWLDGALHVVSGPGEQPAPGLAQAATAEVSARGDHGGHIVTWPATVRAVRPGTEEWDAVVPQLAGKRLNGPGAEALAERWAADGVVSRLTPADDTVTAGADLPDSSQAAPPPPSPAVRAARRPFRLHRVRRHETPGSANPRGS